MVNLAQGEDEVTGAMCQYCTLAADDSTVKTCFNHTTASHKKTQGHDQVQAGLRLTAATWPLITDSRSDGRVKQTSAQKMVSYILIIWSDHYNIYVSGVLAHFESVSTSPR